ERYSSVDLGSRNRDDTNGAESVAHASYPRVKTPRRGSTEEGRYAPRQGPPEMARRLVRRASIAEPLRYRRDFIPSDPLKLASTSTARFRRDRLRFPSSYGAACTRGKQDFENRSPARRGFEAYLSIKMAYDLFCNAQAKSGATASAV